jgi:integrase
MSHQSVTAESPTAKKLTTEKLTTASARKLEPPSGKTDHFYWDEDFPGFGVRVRASRKRISRMWVYQFDIAGRTRRVTLGSVIAIGIEAARKTAGEISGKVRLGRDPVREKAESRARAANTFANVMESYLTAAKLRLRTSTLKNKEGYFRNVCELLYPLPFTAITRRDIAKLLTSIDTQGKCGSHNNVRASLMALFNWAIKKGLTENNPVLGTEQHAHKSRERVLSLPELTAIWHAAGDMPVSIHDFTAIIRLFMLTGQRRTEIGGLRWREIVGDTIVLPPERTKNGRRHIVPLSKPAQVILLTRPRGPNDGFVLRRQSGTTLDWNRYKASLDDALVKRGHTLAPWTNHDLRRSVATHMGEMGIQPHVIECVLNHVSGSRAGVAGTYNRSKLEKPKREALEAWGEYLMAHIEGRKPDDKVVQLRA